MILQMLSMFNFLKEFKEKRFEQQMNNNAEIV